MADDRGEQVELSIEIEPLLETTTAAKSDQPDEEQVRMKNAPVANQEEVPAVADEEEMRMKTAPSLEPAVAEEEVRMKTAQTSEPVVTEEEVRMKTVQTSEPAVTEEEVRMKTTQTSEPVVTEEEVQTKTAPSLEPAVTEKEEVPPLSFRDSNLKAAKAELTSKIGQPQSLNCHVDPNTTQDGVHYRDSRIPEELVDFPVNEDGIIRLGDMQNSKPVPVPRRLTRITKDDDPRLDRHVSRRHRRVQEAHSSPRFAVPILAGDDSAWDQVDEALKSEDREDILRKVL